VLDSQILAPDCVVSSPAGRRAAICQHTAHCRIACRVTARPRTTHASRRTARRRTARVLVVVRRPSARWHPSSWRRSARRPSYRPASASCRRQRACRAAKARECAERRVGQRPWPSGTDVPRPRGARQHGAAGFATSLGRGHGRRFVRLLHDSGVDTCR
jgi:hypothetical protein